ncbi:MAG: type II toxin-antitoxin system RelE/ParE family toxin [Chromatiales bacterium]
MRHEVSLTADAERDLEEMYDYIAAHDGPAKADYVLDRVEKVVEGLSTFPERGSFPKELAALGMREYRQAFVKPYRVIYRVLGQHVYIFLIADGWRDIQTLLARRLFGM